MKKLLGISIVGLLCGVSLALAEAPAAAGTGAPAPDAQHSPGRHFAEHFTKMDANNDGKVSKAELQASMQARFDEHFAKMDTNKDGVLTRDELANGFHSGHGRGHGRGHHHECKGDQGTAPDHG